MFAEDFFSMALPHGIILTVFAKDIKTHLESCCLKWRVVTQKNVSLHASLHFKVTCQYWKDPYKTPKLGDFQQSDCYNMPPSEDITLSSPIITGGEYGPKNKWQDFH